MPVVKKTKRKFTRVILKNGFFLGEQNYLALKPNLFGVATEISKTEYSLLLKNLKEYQFFLLF